VLPPSAEEPFPSLIVQGMVTAPTYRDAENGRVVHPSLVEFADGGEGGKYVCSFVIFFFFFFFGKQSTNTL
jgi:hypothetical protein